MIDFDNFVYWAESRFDSVKQKGSEVCLNSIFTDDNKHKLWCNPSGGKKGIEGGVYHCWKTNKSGSLLNLVMLVDKCSFENAKQILNANVSVSFYELEEQIRNLVKKSTKETKENTLFLPQYTDPIDELPITSKYRQKAIAILAERKIPTDGLLVCYAGKYINRIVIPWYDFSGKLIYYNARSMDNELQRYKFPPKEIGIGKGDIVYFPREPNGKVYITEGEFDAMTLNLCGYSSCAIGGKFLTDKQMKIISPYPIVLSFDSDDAGKEALLNIGQQLTFNSFQNIRYIRPPKGIKDWNEMLVKYDNNTIKSYIAEHEKPFDYLTVSLR